MSLRAVLLNVGACAVLGAGSVGLMLSCSAPDPGEVTFIERKPSGVETGSSNGDPSASSSSSTSSTSSTSSSTSSTSSTGGPPTDAFAGAAAYQQPATTPNTSTNANGHGTNPNPAGRDCLSCHNINNGNAPVWSFAGTVYDTTGNALPNVEVRGLDKNGKPATKAVYTDANGNFWSDETTFVPVKMGVRNAAKMMQMGTLLNPPNDLSCQRSTCHNSPGGQAKISL